MKRKALILTLLLGSLTLALPGCGSKGAADSANGTTSTSAESGAATEAEGITNYGVTIDPDGEAILSHAFCTWIPNPSQNPDETAPAISLTEHDGAKVNDVTYNMNVNNYSTEDTVSQFNIDLLPGTDGTGYRLLLVYLPMDGSFSENEFFLIVNEVDVKGTELTLKETGEIMYIAENAASTTQKDDISDNQAGDDLLPLLPEGSETPGTSENATVNYFKLDYIEYKNGSKKTAEDFDGYVVMASNPSYPEHMMGMLGSQFPGPFEVSEINGKKMIRLEADNSGILEGMRSGEVNNFPFSMNEDGLVIDLSGEDLEVKTISFKAVTAEEFYAGGIETFYGLFDDM